MNTKFKYIALCVCGLALATSASAQVSNLNSTDQERISYCYGVYQATNNPQEVQKHNALLEKLGKTYTQIKSHPAFQKGLTAGKNVPDSQKRSCKLIVYGFLGIGYMRVGYTDTEPLNQAYCVGYMNIASNRNDEDLIKEYCSTGNTPTEKPNCYQEMSSMIKNNSQYRKGKEDAKNVNPLRLIKCYQLLDKSTEEEINASFQAKSSKNTGATTQKKVYPKQEKNTTIKPIF